MTVVADVIQIGDPRSQVVIEAPLVTTYSGDGILLFGERRIEIPSSTPGPTPELRRLVWELRARTGWSARQLARVLGTTHTTINRVENGGRLVRGHSGELRRRVSDAHDVVF